MSFFLVMSDFVICDKLVYVIFVPALLEVVGYCDEIKQGLESLWYIGTLIIFFVFWLCFEIVNGVLDLLERSLDIVEIFLVTKGQMFDVVGEIEIIALSSEHHDDVAVGVGVNMEISWHSISLEESLKMAALLLVKFFLNTIFDGTTPVILFIHLLSTKNLARA